MPRYIVRGINPYQLKRARELRIKGFTLSAIKRILHLDVSIQTVWKAIRDPNYGSQTYSGNWRFTKQQIIQIRNMVKYSKFSRYSRGRYTFIKSIATYYGTSVSHIYYIITFRRWREL